MPTDQLPMQIDRYVIDRKLSQGGMAEVFLAHRDIAGVKQTVVVKSVLPDFLADESFVAMMLNEARIAVNLRHPNIVQVEDLVEVDGRPFIVMEFLDGKNLREIVKQSIDTGRPLSLPFVCSVIADVLDGLGHAHDRVDEQSRSLGLVHRDVSLANVIVTWNGMVKLIDFGVAKATSMADQQLTQVGQVKGKCAYMSPEQVRREPLDRRSDLFSVGIILWELLTRRRLYWRKRELDSMIAICDVDAPPPSSVVAGLPPELDAICRKALMRDRNDRYQTAEEMRRDLEAFIVNEGWQQTATALESELSTLFPDESSANDVEVEEIVVAESAPSPAEGFAAAPAWPAYAPVESSAGSGRLRPQQSAEILMLNNPAPGPSVYDDLEIDGTESRRRLPWGRMLVAAACVLLIGAMGTAMAQCFTHGAAASIASSTTLGYRAVGGGR